MPRLRRKDRLARRFGAGSEGTNLRQRFPFGLPAAQAPLVLLRHGREQHRDERGNARRGRQHRRAPDRVAHTLLDSIVENYKPALEELSMEIAELEQQGLYRSLYKK